jgi:hypothetical protein
MAKGQKIIIGTLVAVLAVAIIASYAMRKHQPGVQQTNLDRHDAPAGQVVQGFPAALLLDGTAKADESYLINYTGQTQYTATFKTQTNAQKLWNQYLAYFKTNGWKIVNKNSNPKVSDIYATKGNEVVNFVIATVPEGNLTSTVTISYVK